MKNYRYPQSTLYSPPSSQTPVFKRHIYSLRTLIILTTGYIVSCIVFLVPFVVTGNMGETNSTSSLPTTIAAFMDIGLIGLLAVVVILLIIDWRGFTTINGWIKWSRMKTWQKLVLGYFFIGFSPYIPVPYLIQAYKAYFDDKRQEPLHLQQKIAEQEVQLGIMPLTNGSCRVCNQPLQQGAEYCVYCGATVTEHPRICPNCAAVTFPNAKWCPKCRTQLSGR